MIDLPYRKEKLPPNHKGYIIKVSGLKGGHSGDDIEKGRGNANKILNRFLWEASDNYALKLSVFDGGNLRNAIAREAFAVTAIPMENTGPFEGFVQQFEKTARHEFRITEPDLKIACETTEDPTFIMSSGSQTNLLNSLYACPHGVIAWSQDIPNFVETSTNLASVKTQEDSIRITTSQRSSVESAKEDTCQMVAATFKLAGAATEHTDGYPGWTPNPDSQIMETTVNSYKELFSEEPIVRAVHAGLECGLIGAQYPEMDMISYGPTIRGAHSPDEKLEISTVVKFWDLTLDVLKKIPVK